MESMESSYRKTAKRHESSTVFSSTPCQLSVNNSGQILKMLSDLYKEKKMCDVFLKVGDKEYGAHRLILSASSDVFQVMLMKSEWNESSQNQVVLNEIPQCEKVFHSFLEYFYTGELMITHTNVQPILSLADKYMVKSLSKLCLQYMFDHVHHASYYNQLFSWLQYFQSCGPKEMATVCEDFIKLNFETVSTSTDFFNMDPETMVFILKQDDIVIYNEVMLYNCVVKWLNLQKAKLEAENDRLKNELRCDHEERRGVEEIAEYIKYLTELVMQYIRFPMIKPREIADLLRSPLVKENKEFFWDKMSMSMELHSDNYENIAKSWQVDNKHLLQPRLYTMETFCATLSINNFKSLPSFYKSSFEFDTSTSIFERNDMELKNKWTAHLFAKGVLFDPGYLVIWQGRFEIPQKVVPTVRLRISCVELYTPGKFKFAILIHGVTRNIEHIMKVRSEIHNIHEENTELNIDDIIPYDMLNEVGFNHDNSYLVGVQNNELKLQIIITPIT